MSEGLCMMKFVGLDDGGSLASITMELDVLRYIVESMM